jgi:succinoglycan biosynthesis transport protein ExoP
MALGDSSPRKEPSAAGQRLQVLHASSVPSEATQIVWPYDGEENAVEPEPVLAQYWRVLWRHRLIIAGAVLAGVAVAVAVTLLAVPSYTAKTVVQIDREAAKVVNMQGGQSDEFYQTQYGLLKSKALAERVVATLGLASSPDFLHATHLDSAKQRMEKGTMSPRLFQDRLVTAVTHGLGVEPVRGSRLVALTFTNPNPNLAAQIANNFADGFIATNLERRYESSSYARDFLEKQLALAKARLEDSERAAVAYAVQQQIINLHQDSGGDPNAQQPLIEKNLATLDEAYELSKAARIAAQAKWDQARSGNGLALPEIQENQTIQQLSQEEARQQSQYQDQLRLVKPRYPAMVELKAQIDELDARIQSTAATIRQSVKSQYEAAVAQENNLGRQVDALKASDLDLKNRSIKYNFLQREVDTNRTLYDGLLQRYKEIGVTGGVAANNVSIVDRAEAPLRPSFPNPLLNLSLGLLAGLACGVLGAFAAEALDQAIQGPSDVDRKLGLPILGAVPLLTKGVTPQEAMMDSRSAFWEAYYSIRTALQFSSTSGVPRSMLIVSARPGEGKSTTAAALAQGLARLGTRTLLVDADLRKPSIHRVMGLNPSPGLSNYLTGAMTLDDIMQSTDQPQLMVVTSGPLPPTPAELLADNRIRRLIADAQDRFDLVLFDGPPVMGFADAPLLASVVEGTVLVVESGKTGRPVVLSAIQRLRMAHAKILGVVLAKYDKSAGGEPYGSGYGYGYYAYEYGERAETGKTARISKR